MARSKKVVSNLVLIPMLPHETLDIGIDVGTFRHVAGFLSRTLLQRHQRDEGCPTVAFEQSREGFRAFVDRLREDVPLEQATVLLEHTGHSHKNLEQYLLEWDIPVSRIHVQERPKGMLKTDKRDALGLANRLSTQWERGAQVEERMQLVRRAAQPTPAAMQWQGFLQHRSELSHQRTQLRNKLTAICDELFPELTQIVHDPHLEVALAFREKFPPPHAMATASLSALRETRVKYFPSEASLLRLQQLARQTIGIHNVDRLRGRKVEQELLLKELRLVQEHFERLDTAIADIVRTCREGQIWLSMPPIGPVQAATLMATRGHLENFENASELKSYFGWAPTRDQTGVCFDRTKLTHRGVRPVKPMLFLMAARATTLDGEWARLSHRFLPRLATSDERVQEYRGKKKVIGRIAGPMVSMIVALLKTDQETLSRVPPGEEPPPPRLSDPEVHRKHQEGSDRSLKPGTQPRKRLQLPSQSWWPSQEEPPRFLSLLRRKRGRDASSFEKAWGVGGGWRICRGTLHPRGKLLRKVHTTWLFPLPEIVEDFLPGGMNLKSNNKTSACGAAFVVSQNTFLAF